MFHEAATFAVICDSSHRRESPPQTIVVETSLEVAEGPRLWAESTGRAASALAAVFIPSFRKRRVGFLQPCEVPADRQGLCGVSSLLLTEVSAVYENGFGAC